MVSEQENKWTTADAEQREHQLVRPTVSCSSHSDLSNCACDSEFLAHFHYSNSQQFAARSGWDSAILSPPVVSCLNRTTAVLRPSMSHIAVLSLRICLESC
jgi:hypothetical protein